MLAHTPVEHNNRAVLAKIFIIPLKQNQFIRKTIFDNAPVRRIVIALITNSALTALYTENLFWYQQVDLRQIRILKGGQPIVDIDSGGNCCLYVTTTKAMSFLGHNPSIRFDNLKDHHVLVFDLTSLQVATENCQYPELIGEPPRLVLGLPFPIEHVTELIALGERMPSVALDKFGAAGENSEMDTVPFQQIFSRIPLFKLRYRGAFISDYVPAFDNDIFALINTQPSKMQGELWIMIASSRQILFFKDSRSWKVQFLYATLREDGARITTVPSQRVRLLHDISSFSSL